MNRTKLTFVALLVCLFSGSATAQIYGTDGFLMSESLEIGIGSNGAEGSSSLPPVLNHARAYTPRLSIVANQQNDGWTNYNGDYTIPGSPENRFGIEVDGVTYCNSSIGLTEIPGPGMSNYQEIDGCQFIDWDGSVAGIDIHQSWKHDTSQYFYTVQVTLTNTTAFDKSDVYFFKSMDADNNQSIGWGFATENEVEKQPSGEYCPLALVSSTDNEAWDSYIGLGGMGDDIRVSTGGFFVDDASAVWNGTAPYSGVAGVKVFADQAIAISHKDNVIPAGESTTFEFVVIMKKSESTKALMNLAHFMDDDFFTFWYDDGDDVPEVEPVYTETCSDTSESIYYGGVIYYESGIPDTLRRCTEDEIMLIVETPDSDDPDVVSPYNVEWAEATGEDTLTFEMGVDTVIIPATLPDTVTYLCFVGAGPCYGVGYGIVHEYTVITIQTPEVIITGPGVLCQDSLLLTDIEAVDSFDVEGTVTTYHVTMPEDAEDDSDLWPTDYAYDGDSVYVMIATTETGCYDVELAYINLSPLNAGADGTAPAVCNEDAATVDLNTYLDGEAEDIAGVWASEVAAAEMAIDAATGIFTPLDLPAGTYNFYYIVGGDPCPLDSATITIEVMNFNSAGEDGLVEVCSAPGLTVNLNDVLDGNEVTGVWAEVTGTGAFDAATGILDVSGLAVGYYSYSYTVTSTSPCMDDVAMFTVSVVPGPTASFTFTPGSVFTDDSEVTFTNTSSDATSYEWNFGDDTPISVEENPIHTYPAVAGIYEINLKVENDLGCADSLQAFIKVKEVVTFYIPNTFTPDGNAKNDNFLPVFESGFDPYNYHMVVYNRYGEIVFESYDASAGWDGTFGTEGIVQGGIYTWSIEFKELDTDRIQQHKGHVTILK